MARNWSTDFWSTPISLVLLIALFSPPETSAQVEVDAPEVPPMQRLPDVGASAVDPAPDHRMSLDDARQWALSNSDIARQLGAQVVRDPLAASSVYDTGLVASDPVFGIAAAQSEFDAVLSGNTWYNKYDRVFNNLTLGGGATELQQDLTSMDVGVSQVAANGARVAGRHVTLYDANNRFGNLFPNTWESYWEAEVRQPLLQGRGRLFNEIAGPQATPGLRTGNGIRIARLNRDISETEFKISIQEFVSAVDEAYWRLYQANREFEAVSKVRAAAVRIWHMVKAKSDQGLAGGESYREAQARENVCRYDDMVVEATFGSNRLLGLAETRRELGRLLGIPPEMTMGWRPADRPALTPDVADYESMRAAALVHRPELALQRQRVQAEELKLAASRNFTLPRLDAVGRYRLRGFGDDLGGGNGRFSSAGNDLNSFDHQEWEFGMEMQVPVNRRRATSAVRHAELHVVRQRAILQEQQHQICHELQRALQSVEQTAASAQASQNRLRAAADRVFASEAAFTAGHLTLDQLLDAHERRFEAELRYEQLLAAHMIAKKNVQLQAGLLLEDFTIE